MKDQENRTYQTKPWGIERGKYNGTLQILGNPKTWSKSPLSIAVYLRILKESFQLQWPCLILYKEMRKSYYRSPLYDLLWIFFSHPTWRNNTDNICRKYMIIYYFYMQYGQKAQFHFGLQLGVLSDSSQGFLNIKRNKGVGGTKKKQSPEALHIFHFTRL